MAAEAKYTTNLQVTGLGEELNCKNTKTSATTPEEKIKLYSVLGASAETLKLGDIAAGDGFLLYMKAVSGNFYIDLGSTSSTPSSSTSTIYIVEGNSALVPINPDSSAMPGIRVKGSVSGASLEYAIVAINTV